RKVVLTVAQQAGVAVKEEPLTEADLSTADEVLLTGTTIEVLPVVRVDGRPIGAGAPGPVTRLVMDRFRRALAEYPLAVARIGMVWCSVATVLVRPCLQSFVR